MEFLLLLLQLLGLAYVFVLPGWLIATQLAETWSRPVRFAVGITLGVLIVPTACFCAAWLLRTSVQPSLVIGVATVINAVALAARSLRRRRRAARDADAPQERAEGA